MFDKYKPEQVQHHPSKLIEQPIVMLLFLYVGVKRKKRLLSEFSIDK